MPLKQLCVAVAAALLAATDAESASSIFDFGLGLSEATVTVEGKTFRIYTNKRGRDSILLQAAIKDSLGGMNPAAWPLADWRRAAETLVAPVGCGIEDVAAVTRIGASWEATYVCPPGVDLRALIREQSADLKQGAPLHR